MPIACEMERQSLYQLVAALSDDLSTQVKAISDRYQPQLDDLREDAPDPGGIAVLLRIDVDVSWQTIAIAIDLPEVTMTLQEWKFDLPQVTMTDKALIFHTPSVRMVDRKVGQYPEFHGLSVRWRDIIISVPEVFMQEQRIVMGIPEVRMDTTSIKLDIPEFTMRTQEIKFDVPQVTIRSIDAEAHDLEARARTVASSMEQEIAAKRGEILGTARERVVASASTLFTCLRTQIQMQRDETAAMFEPGLAMIQGVVSKLQSVGASEELDRTREKLSALLASRDAAVGGLDASIQSILDQEKSTVDALLRGLGDRS